MDKKLKAKEKTLEDLLSKRDTTERMTKVIEHSVIEVTAKNSGDSRSTSGRGKTTIRMHKGPTECKINPANHSIGEGQHTRLARSLLKQARRCKAWADRLNIRTRGNLDTQHLNTFRKLYVSA